MTSVTSSTNCGMKGRERIVIRISPLQRGLDSAARLRKRCGVLYPACQAESTLFKGASGACGRNVLRCSRHAALNLRGPDQLWAPSMPPAGGIRSGHGRPRRQSVAYWHTACTP
jgi:hypothetical protein